MKRPAHRGICEHEGKVVDVATMTRYYRCGVTGERCDKRSCAIFRRAFGTSAEIISEIRKAIIK